jgi:hypothetical protein
VVASVVFTIVLVTITIVLVVRLHFVIIVVGVLVASRLVVVSVKIVAEDSRVNHSVRRQRSNTVVF